MGASKPIIVAIVVLDLIAIGLGLAAERRRAPGRYESPSNSATQWCYYTSDISTGLAIGAFGFLFISQVLLTVATRCLCCGNSLKPGTARAFASIFCILNWMFFIGAEACLLAGAVQDARHIRYFSSTFGKEISCEAIRKDTFVAGVALTAFTCFLGVSYYLCYLKAQEAFGKVQFDRVDAGVSMAHYP